MSTWFNDAKDGQKYATLTVDKTTESIEFTEAKYIDGGDDKFYILANVTKCPDAAKMGDKNWKFSEQVCLFSLPKKAYSTEYNGNKKEYAPFPMSVLLLERLKEIGDKPFAGTLAMASPDYVKALETGEFMGNPLDDKAKAFMIKAGADIQPIEALDKLKDIEVKVSKGGYRGGSGGQSAKAACLDRLDFILLVLENPDKLDKVIELANGFGVAIDKGVLISGWLDNVVR